MDLLTLKAELTSDALARGYSGMDAAAAAASLNTADRPSTRPLTSAELLAWAAGNARFVRIEAAAEMVLPDPTDPTYAAKAGLKSIAKAAYILIHRETVTLDLTLPDRQQMVGALVQAGVLTEAEQTQLYALAALAVSRAAELRLPAVTPGDVEQARAL